MEQILIRASIVEEKMSEFKQSKLTFIEELELVPGYMGYAEIPGTNYQISLQWNSRRELEAFLDSDLYSYFTGAVKTLGSILQVTISSQKEHV